MPCDQDHPQNPPANRLALILAIDAGEYRLARLSPTAWKLRGSGARGPSCYTVEVVSGRVECSCPDFTHRHRSRGTRCKHAAAVLELGLLELTAEPQPEPQPEPTEPQIAAAED